MSGQRRRYHLLLTYALLLCPVVGYGAWKAFDAPANAPTEWVSTDFPARKVYEEFSGNFGSGDVLIASWDGCTLDDPNLSELTSALRRSRSFFDADNNWYFQGILNGQRVYQHLVRAPLSLHPNTAAERLQGTFVGPDLRTTCIVITFSRAGLDNRKQVLPLLQSMIEKHCGIPPEHQHLAGPVMEGLAIDLASRRALERFALPSAAAVLLLCCLCLRSIRAALIVFGIAIYAQFATLGLLHYGGDTLSALLIVMPPLIQALAVAGGMHLVNYYYAAAREGDANASRQAFHRGWLPCILSSVATAVGLAALTVSDLIPLRVFGAYAVAGVFVNAGLLLTFIPGTLAVWPISVRTPGDNKGKGDKTPKTPMADRFWGMLTALVARAHPLVNFATLAGMIALGWGLKDLATSVHVQTLFPENSRLLKDYAWIENHLGPRVPIEVIVQCDKNCGLNFREQLSLVWRVERALGNLDEVGGTLSAATLSPNFPKRPDLSPDAYQTLIDRTLEGSRASFVNAAYLQQHRDGNRWRVTANVSALVPFHDGMLLDSVRTKVTNVLHDSGAEGVSAIYTGMMPLTHDIQTELMADLIQSFLIALVIITLIMTIVQGAVLPGLVSMIPNLFPTLLIFGGLGWLKIPLDIGSVMTASVALGIAVNDTFHFLTFYQRGITQGLDPRESVHETYRQCGPAMIQTSIACGLGLLVFAFSEFSPTSRFAWMMLSLMGAALIGDLILLPSLLLGSLGKSFNVVEEEDLADLELSTSPSQSSLRGPSQKRRHDQAAQQHS